MNCYRFFQVLCFFIACEISLYSQVDPQAFWKAQKQRIAQKRELNPADGLLIYHQAMVYANLGEKEEALKCLRSLLGRRLGLIPDPELGFAHLQDDSQFLAIKKQLEDEERKIVDAPVVVTLNENDLIVEGVAWEERTDRFYFGSLAKNKIVSVNGKGVMEDISQEDDALDSVYGMAVDQRLKFLYAISSNALHPSGMQERRNHILWYRVDDEHVPTKEEIKAAKKEQKDRMKRLPKEMRALLEQLKDVKIDFKRSVNSIFVDRIPVPDAHQLNDVAIGPNSDLYVSDTVGGTVYHMSSSGRTIKAYGPVGKLRGVNGLTVSPDNRLYVALPSGIALVEPEKIEMLSQPDTLISGGIDGLYWYKGDLLGIQNGCNPGRVIRLKLDATGRKIEQLTVLQSHHHPAFNAPTTGTIRGDKFYVLANSQIGRLQPDGSLKDVASIKPAVLIEIPLE